MYLMPLNTMISSFNEITADLCRYQMEALKLSSDSLDTELSKTPYDIVYQNGRVKLKRYKPAPETEKRMRTPLLVVYALINRETMLDLQPERSVVRNLLKAGIDLYLVDWGNPTQKDKYQTISDHVNGYINDMVDYIRHTHQLPKINLMGVCMGGTFSLIYAALYPHKVKNLITTVTPTNFDTDTGLLHVWAKHLDPDQLMNMFGNMPGDLMNLGFLMLNPARLMIDKYKSFYENIKDKEFVENFIRMEKWIFDSPDVPGATFRQFITDCYQQNLLIQSRMEIEGRKVDLSDIDMPLLNIYAKYDHLVPPAACDQLIHRVASPDARDVCLETGHIGIYVSSKFQKLFAPQIASWLWERDSAVEDLPAARVA